jgi:molecular chaperone IbpA
MRTVDFSPFYRSAVGFDRLAALLEAASKADSASGYPPYNIENVGENAYRIEIAVAGFRPEELAIEVKENLLTVTGKKAANDDQKAWLSAISTVASSWRTMWWSPTPTCRTASCPSR